MNKNGNNDRKIRVISAAVLIILTLLLSLAVIKGISFEILAVFILVLYLPVVFLCLFIAGRIKKNNNGNDVQNISNSDYLKRQNDNTEKYRIIRKKNSSIVKRNAFQKE